MEEWKPRSRRAAPVSIEVVADVKRGLASASALSEGPGECLRAGLAGTKAARIENLIHEVSQTERVHDSFQTLIEVREHHETMALLAETWEYLQGIRIDLPRCYRAVDAEDFVEAGFESGIQWARLRDAEGLVDDRSPPGLVYRFAGGRIRSCPIVWRCGAFPDGPKVLGKVIRMNLYAMVFGHARVEVAGRFPQAKECADSVKEEGHEL